MEDSREQAEDGLGISQATVASSSGIPGLQGTLINQGAEARVSRVQFLGKDAVVKYRFSKKYRHPALDAKLTRSRCSAEARCLVRARKLGVAAPALFLLDLESASLVLEFVRGESLKAFLLSLGADVAAAALLQGPPARGRQPAAAAAREEGESGSPLEAKARQLRGVLVQVGEAIARLHDGGVVHGDLTTSNMLLREGDGLLVLIDFGLSSPSTLAEDKGVDLYVLERALLSMHSRLGDLFSIIKDAYQRQSKQWSSTLNRFNEVRLRGRKRTMAG